MTVTKGGRHGGPSSIGLPQVPHYEKDEMVRFLQDDDGQGLTEYALVIALVAIAVISVLSVLGHKSNNSLTNSSNMLS